MKTQRQSKTPFFQTWKAFLFLSSTSLLMSIISLCLVVRCFEQKSMPELYGNDDGMNILLELLVEKSPAARQKRKRHRKNNFASGNIIDHPKQIQVNISTDEENRQKRNVTENNVTPVSVHRRFRLFQPDEPSISVNGGQHVALILDTVKMKPLVEHDRGVEVTTEGIRVIYSGDYYVYSGMNVTVNGSSVGETTSVYVHRVSPNNPSMSGVLLRSIHSRQGETDVTETSFTGGVFYLQGGDIIQVCLSQRQNFVSDDVSSFVGLFLTPQEHDLKKKIVYMVEEDE